MKTRTLNVLRITENPTSDSADEDTVRSLEWFDLNFGEPIPPDQLLGEGTENHEDSSCRQRADIFIVDRSVSADTCQAIIKQQADCSRLSKKPFLVKGTMRKDVKTDVSELLDGVFYVGETIDGADVRRAMMSYEGFWFTGQDATPK